MSVQIALAAEVERLRSLVDDQLRTIKALTHGCEVYGLTETTPIVRHMAAQDAEIERLRAELAECRDALRNIQDQVLTTGIIYQLCEVALARKGEGGVNGRMGQ